METLEIPVETVPSDLLKEENVNEFINKQLVSRMFDSLDGADFEKNMLLETGVHDQYTRVKLGGKTKKDEEYCNKILLHFDQQTIAKLLYICRMCSYLGGPGFPDLVLFGHTETLCYTASKLTPEQILFVLFAQALEVGEVKMLEVVPRGDRKQREPFKIEVKTFLDRIVHSARFAHYGNELGDMLDRERSLLSQGKNIPQHQDEITYLEGQLEGMPFDLIKTWNARGVGKRDIEEHMKRLGKLWSLNQKKTQEVLERVKGDETFASLGKGFDEETREKKKNHLKTHYRIGDSRAEEVLKEQFVG